MTRAITEIAPQEGIESLYKTSKYITSTEISTVQTETPELEIIDDAVEPLSAGIEASNVVVTSEQSSTQTAEKPLVFDAVDVRKPSNITEEQLTFFIARYCPEWVDLESQILEYDSQINLIFLLSVARMETWAGIAAIGDYNCFNTKDFYTGDYVNYSSYLDSIDAFVRLINEQYLSEDGLWWSGGYSVENIGVHYATPVWHEGITNLAEEIKWLLEERVPQWKAEAESQSTIEDTAN